MDYTREHMRPGMKESEVGAMYEGFVHGTGVGYKGKVEMARAFTLVWSGKGNCDVHRHRRPPDSER